jgi:diketogulonate reductase-like aldo/keto reductase
MASVKFFNGYSMPLVGLGTWQASNPDELEKALDAALEAGYRHIDTAYMYQNEQVIGNVLKRWLDSGKIKREELFVTTKLPPIGMRPQHVPHFLQKSLEALQLDYLDLYLIHLPIGLQYLDDEQIWPKKDGELLIDFETDLEAIWKAMETQVENGLARSIGVSNFSISQIERIVNISKIQPANVQVELQVYFQQKALVEACRRHNITVVAYAPIGSPGRKQLFAQRGEEFTPISLLEDPVVVEIAQNHSKTPAQIVMKFLVQQNIAVIPKSTNIVRLRQNIDLFDFELTAEEVKRLTALDQGKEGRTFTFAMLPASVKNHKERLFAE